MPEKKTKDETKKLKAVCSMCGTKIHVIPLAKRTKCEACEKNIRQSAKQERVNQRAAKNANTTVEERLAAIETILQKAGMVK